MGNTNPTHSDIHRLDDHHNATICKEGTLVQNNMCKYTKYHVRLWSDNTMDMEDEFGRCTTQSPQSIDFIHEPNRKMFHLFTIDNVRQQWIVTKSHHECLSWVQAIQDSINRNIDPIENEENLSSTYTTKGAAIAHGKIIFHNTEYSDNQMNVIQDLYNKNTKCTKTIFVFSDNPNQQNAHFMRQYHSFTYGIPITGDESFISFPKTIETHFKELEKKLCNGYDIIIPAPTPMDIHRNHNAYCDEYGDQIIHHKIGINDLRPEYTQYIEFALQQLLELASEIEEKSDYIPVDFRPDTSDDNKDPANEDNEQDVDNEGAAERDDGKHDGDDPSDDPSNDNPNISDESDDSQEIESDDQEAEVAQPEPQQEDSHHSANSEDDEKALFNNDTDASPQFNNDGHRVESDVESVESLSSDEGVITDMTGNIEPEAPQRQRVSRSKIVWEYCDAPLASDPGSSCNDHWVPYDAHICDQISQLPIKEDGVISDGDHVYNIVKYDMECGVETNINTEVQRIFRQRNRYRPRRRRNRRKRLSPPVKPGTPLGPEDETVEALKKRIGYKFEWQCEREEMSLWPPNDIITAQAEHLQIGQTTSFSADIAIRERTVSKRFILQRIKFDIAFLSDHKYSSTTQIRRIERTNASFLGQYPPWWSNASSLSPSPSVEYIKLPEDFLCASLRIAMERWRQTMDTRKYSIESIYGIKNNVLYQKYLFEKSVMKDNSEMLNEKILFHATNDAQCKQITVESFRKEYSQHSRWGEGSYFSKSPFQSHRYGHLSRQDPLPDQKGKWQVLVCKVITGESVVGKFDYTLKHWPRKENGQLVDSLRNTMSSTYVIHNDCRIYPLFLFEFSR
eukprot:121061_1